MHIGYILIKMWLFYLKSTIDLSLMSTYLDSTDAQYRNIIINVYNSYNVASGSSQWPIY